MNNYRYLNLNPDGLDTQDCTIRALSLFLDISWDDAYWGVVTEGFLQKKMPSTDTVWGRYLEKNNCYLTRVPSECPADSSSGQITVGYATGKHNLWKEVI